MTIQITIIGMGRTGTSLGLALKRKAEVAKLKIVGHDSDLQLIKLAQSKGAIDVTEWNLPAACEAADVIYLCVPLSEMRKAMEEVIPYAKAACVITDTAPLKAPLIEWAAELMPDDRYYIGGFPILNPDYLHTGDDTPRADLFDKGLWALVPDANASSEALKLINDLARLVGATPFFVGAHEFDSLMAAINTLPALSAAALMRVVAASPEWPDSRKLADRAFATATVAASMANPAGVRAAAHLNSANVLRLLDGLIEQLTTLRGAVAGGEEAALQTPLTDATITRDMWLTKRREANWEADELPKNELPTPAGMFKQFIGLGRWGELKKDKDKK
jgi:prephenate dehydrogenase